ncbi:7TM diverse intracellular signaling domain-containing protein [Sulfurospirillum sp. 1307]
MKKTFFLIFIFILHVLCFANEIQTDGLFVKSSILTSSLNTTINDIQKSNKFEPLRKERVNFGFNAKISVWLKFEFQNNSNHKLTKSIVLSNPMLEDVFFFDSKKNFKVYKSGMLHVNKQRGEIFPSYSFILQPKEKREIFVRIKNTTTSFAFGVNIYNTKDFIQQDKQKQFFIVFLFGLLSAILIYSLVLFIYTKNISYGLFVLYLFTTAFQQLEYTGFILLYAPSWFNEIFTMLLVLKVSAAIITASIYAISFLNVKQYSLLYRIYKSLIIAAILQIFLFGTPLFYVPEVAMLLGIIFVAFNGFAGVYVHKKGNKRARFFIVGWSFLLIAYLLLTLDAIGLISTVYELPEIILFLTFLEGVFLLLAFTDTINILSHEKKLLHEKLVKEMSSRESVIKNEVKQKTKELNIALSDKNLLLKELQHRVKNNLQLILSVTRLQRRASINKNSIDEFYKLEKRIRAVAKTHELLCLKNDIETIDMKEYIIQLCEEIQGSIMEENIKIYYDINITLPFSKAVYIGIIINELISNSIKHAFKKCAGEIYIKLSYESSKYILIVSDTGDGYNFNDSKPNTLGLKLIHSLVLKQLKGSIDISKNDLFEYKIIWS